jgi:hypothetical protein
MFLFMIILALLLYFFYIKEVRYYPKMHFYYLKKMTLVTFLLIDENIQKILVLKE